MPRIEYTVVIDTDFGQSPDSNLIVRESWFLGGVLHRYFDPAVFIINENGNIAMEAWYQNGKLHRDDGPAYIEYDEATQLPIVEWWCRNGQYYRFEGGPTHIVRDASSEIEVISEHCDDALPTTPEIMTPILR